MPEEKIKEALERVIIEGVGRSIVGLGIVRGIEGGDGRVRITLASTGLNPDMRAWVERRVREELKDLAENVEINFVEASAKELSRIDHTIAIMSGKGGVGKSLVTALLGVGLRRKGYEVGILDADITGPSIPKMFGVGARPAGSETGILPVSSRCGIEIMSINLLLPQEDDPVIWRGPLIGKAIKQFWEDVIWGRLDFLLVDLPPGTADAPLTVMQTLPLTGIIIVFSPQELATMVVRKAVKMARRLNIPLLGVVENMSYLYIPELDKKIEIFGRSRAEEMARAAEAPLLGRIPIDPELAKLCDEGKIEEYGSDTLESLLESLLERLGK